MRRLTGVLAVAAFLAFGVAGAAVGQTVPEVAQKMQPMAADADPSFEVATIKPSKPDEVIKSIPPIGYRTVLPMTTVLSLVSFAYDVQDKQIVGAPDWIASEKFDIDGVSDTPGTPSVQQVKIMIQKLLADRFQLKFHREKREMPAYVLVVGKKGEKLDKSKEDPSSMPRMLLRVNFPKSCTMTAQNVMMADFAHMMQSAVLDRPMVDQTGLQGKYDFVLTWAPDESQFPHGGARLSSPPPTDNADAPPGLFTALQEQLGLRLDAEKKAAVEVMMIDKVEQPSAN